MEPAPDTVQALYRPGQRSEQLIAAYYAAGMSTSEISAKIGRKESFVRRILKRPTTLAHIEDLQKQVISKVVSEAATLAQKADFHAHKAVDTLVELMDDVPHPKIRLGAASKMVDIAPSLRKNFEGEGSRHIHIHLPLKHLKDMEKAFIDIQDAESLRLLEEARNEEQNTKKESEND